ECALRTSVTGADDLTISWDESRGDYEGEPSTIGDYTVFTVTADIGNYAGDAQANRVRATLLLPEDFTLEEGERAIKSVDPADIPVQGQSSVSWKVRPIAVGVPVDRTFEVLITAENAAPEKCQLEVTLAEAPRLVQVAMPNDVVGSYGQKVTVPVLVGETLGRDVFAYKLTIRFDPMLVRFVDATSANTLTGRGWNGVKATVYSEAGSPEPNLLRIEDFTTGSPLSTSRTGALTMLRFEVVHNREDINAVDYVLQSALEFLDEVVTSEGGRFLVSSMNSVRDDQGGEITLAMTPGMVTVSGDCILPLSSSTRLEQNTPNPFNPATVIRYELGTETDYHLTLHDALGRKVRTLEEGHKTAGQYQYILNAGNLPSGVYLYRLEAGDFVESKRMVLSK
ncbi:MAG: T9SS type A sorting domain-containing protein, partial [Bacteroidetes bacterium]|nr:T9SS type A sorting domain-containing protein [Bacteroidota bacterium]